MGAPLIDNRDLALLEKEMKALAPFYTPEWKAADQADAGVALLKIFGLMLEGVIKRLNQAPDKQFIAFLNMLGTRLQPARSARLPLTFFLSSGAVEPVVVPAGTQAAADRPGGGGQLAFEVEKTMLVTPARMVTIFSCVPGSDQFFEHTPVLASGNPITLFTGTGLQEHALYLGHMDLFNLPGAADIKVVFDPDDLAGKLEGEQWEYWGEAAAPGHPKTAAAGWQRLDVGSAGGGEITLKKNPGEIRDDHKVNGAPNRWIRCKLSKLNIGDVKDHDLKELRVSVSPPSKEGIAPDMAFYNDIQLDLSQPFYPLGARPPLNAAFYLASREAFSKKGAAVTINVTLHIPDGDRPDKPKASADAVLAWEYWDGAGWKALGISEEDAGKQPGADMQTGRDKQTGAGRVSLLTANGRISFACPDDMAQAAVAGQQNYWIRARLVNGDYGQMKYDPNTSKPIPDYHPPVISRLTMEYQPEPAACQACWAFNNGEYAAYPGSGKPHPFVPLDDEHQALYLGFDRPPVKGPISIMLSPDEQWRPAPRLLWQYWSSEGSWKKLDVQDNTSGFTLNGTIEFVGPKDLALLSRFGKKLCWIRAVDSRDHFGATIDRVSLDTPRILGIYPNTTWALQAATVQGEVLGSSDGTAGQSFKLTKYPVISERIWVNELGFLTDPDIKALIESGGQVQEVKDTAGATTAYWVCWEPVDDLPLAAAGRSYEMDRATGAVLFGDGVHGAIPPAGSDNIRADYQAGGGSVGNVAAQAVSALKTSLAFIDHVSNPIAGAGGCDTEQVSLAVERGPQVIRHRNYAVTAEDYERLALQASRGIARAKCLPNFDLQARQEQNGCVAVILVSAGDEAQPTLSAGLKQQVQQYLSERASNVVTAPRRLQVDGPAYVEVSVTATLFTARIDLAPAIEREALQQLAAFLHPLTGGPDGRGWEFGWLPGQSDFYRLLEGVDGVDHVEGLVFQAWEQDGATSAGGAAGATGATGVDKPVDSMAPYALICSGKHTIDGKLAVEGAVDGD
jgi:hypothetical protein